MQKVRCSALVVLLFASLLAAGQDSTSSPSASGLDGKPTPATPPAAAPATPGGMPSAALTVNDVVDRVVQREHYFIAQMRHMHPLVETYLQDLKSDSNGHPYPVNDHYFLGRLDMSDGPEEASFVGQSAMLTAREFALMQALLARPGTVLSRSELERQIYGWNEEVGSNAIEYLI